MPHPEMPLLLQLLVMTPVLLITQSGVLDYLGCCWTKA